jgi:hypothetical protein
MTDGADPLAMLELARRLADATASGDIEAMEPLYEPDLVVWHNFDEGEQDLAQSLRSTSWLHARVERLAFENVHLLATAEGFVICFVMTGQAPGGPLRAPSCQVATVSERGLIERIDEYIDANQIAPLYG